MNFVIKQLGREIKMTYQVPGFLREGPGGLLHSAQGLCGPHNGLQQSLEGTTSFRRQTREVASKNQKWLPKVNIFGEVGVDKGLTCCLKC